MNETEAATLIQQRWRAFAQVRRGAADEARIIAACIGEWVPSLEKFYEYQKDGKLVVQCNGVSGRPTEGHSCFYQNYFFHDLAFRVRSEADNCYPRKLSRFPINSAGTHAAVRFGDDARLDIDPDITPFTLASARARIVHLIEKKVMYVVDDDYAQHFQAAFHLERLRFVRNPFSYGLHYNCNTLVVAVLRRMLELGCVR